MHCEAEHLFARYVETGDPVALGDVFDATAPQLLRSAVHLTRDTAQAEDVLQATFLTAIEKARTWDSSRPLLPWLHGILVRQVRKLAAADARQPDPERWRCQHGVDATDLPGTTDPLTLVEHRESAELLRQQVSRLPEIYSQVLRLRLQHGLSPGEIAEVLDLAPGTVRMRLQRAVTRLRGALPLGTGLGLLSTATPGQGLAVIKTRVLEHTARCSPALMLGGALVMKKSLFALVGILALAVLWSAWPWSTQESAPADGRPGASPELQTRDLAARQGERGQEDAAELRQLAPWPATEPWQPAGFGALRVRVVDTQGQAVPMVGMLVEPLDGRDPVLHRRCGATDALGMIQLSDLPAGKVELLLDRDHKQSAEIAAGATTECEIMLEATGQIRGRVVNGAGLPVPKASIWVRRNTSRALAMPVGRADLRGRFTLRCLASHTFVGAVAPGLAASNLLPVDAEEGRPLTIVLDQAAARVRGLVLDGDAQAVAGAVVRVGGRFGGRSVRVSANEWHRGWSPITVRTASDGSFAVDSLPGGPVEFLVHATGWAPHTEHIILRSSILNEVTLHLITGAALRGRVLDPSNRPVSGAHVAVSSSGYILAVATTTSTEGRFDLRGLAAGPMRLQVNAPGLAPFVDDYTVLPGQRLELEVPLRATQALRGRLTGPDGEPLAGWLVWVRGTGVQIADAQGRFHSAVGARRRVALAVSSPALRHFVNCDWLGTITVEAAELEVAVPRRFMPSATVRGRLVDDTGQPAVSARLQLMQSDALVQSQTIDAPTARFRFGPIAPGWYELRWRIGTGENILFGQRQLRLEAEQALNLGDLDGSGEASMPGGCFALALRRADGVAIQNPSVHLRDAAGREFSSLFLDRNATGKQYLRPGPYSFSVLSDNAQWHRGSFVIEAGKTLRRRLELAPATRRYILFPWPIPPDWQEVRQLSYVIEDPQGRVLDTGELAPEEIPHMYMPALRVGHHRVTLTTDDGRRYAGGFEVHGLHQSHRPIAISVQPSR